MNDKIEIGEYVRTNNGIIGKLIKIERDDIDTSLKWYVFNDGKNERYINKPYIVKHSKNIIDLLEVGDYVNGHIINDITNITDDEYEIDEEDDWAVKKGIYLKCGDEEGCIIIESNNIKSILTKEMYEQNCYRVEE